MKALMAELRLKFITLFKPWSIKGLFKSLPSWVPQMFYNKFNISTNSIRQRSCFMADSWSVCKLPFNRITTLKNTSTHLALSWLRSPSVSWSLGLNVIIQCYCCWVIPGSKCGLLQSAKKEEKRVKCLSIVLDYKVNQICTGWLTVLNLYWHPFICPHFCEIDNLTQSS